MSLKVEASSVYQKVHHSNSIACRTAKTAGRGVKYTRGRDIEITNSRALAV
jgi:hypothetical protein